MNVKLRLLPRSCSLELSYFSVFCSPWSLYPFFFLPNHFIDFFLCIRSMTLHVPWPSSLLPHFLSLCLVCGSFSLKLPHFLVAQ